MTTATHAMCSFSGGAVVAFCERGCCGTSCCSTTETTGGEVTWALIGVISALIFIFFVLVVVYWVLRRKGYCRSRPDAEPGKPWVPPPKKADKKKKNDTTKKAPKKLRKGQIIALNAFDWHGKKKDVQRDSKDTQTDNYKCLPGDFIKWTNGFWLPVKRAKDAPKDDRQNIRDVGVNTDAIKNNARTINIEPKINNTDIVTKVNTAAAVKSLPPPREVKPAYARAAQIYTSVHHQHADYSDVKLPYDLTSRNQRSGGDTHRSGAETHRSGAETQRSTEPILSRGDRREDSGAKSVSFGNSPQPTISTPQPTVSTPRNPERQDTIELLNEFSRQMMNTK